MQNFSKLKMFLFSGLCLFILSACATSAEETKWRDCRKRSSGFVKSKYRKVSYMTIIDAYKQKFERITDDNMVNELETYSNMQVHYAKNVKAISDKEITLKLIKPKKKIFQDTECVLSFQFINKKYHEARNLKKYDLMPGNWEDVFEEKAYYSYFNEEKDKKGLYKHFMNQIQGWLFVFVCQLPKGDGLNKSGNTDVSRNYRNFSIPEGASVVWDFDLAGFCRSKDGKTLPPGKYKIWMEAKMTPVNDFDGLRLISNPVIIKIQKGKDPNPQKAPVVKSSSEYDADYIPSFLK